MGTIMVVKNVEKYRFGHSMINSMFMLVSQRKPRNQVTIIVYICQKDSCNQPKPEIQLMILEDNRVAEVARGHRGPPPKSLD